MRLNAENDNLLDGLSPEEQQRLADVLERYVEGLEQGGGPDVEAIVAEHPELAGAVRAYLTSLDFVHAATASMRTSEPPPLETARQLGDYAIVREIGRGGMGVVYEARQISLGRRVALKVLPFAAVLDRKQVARFHNEAQAAAHLQHPHIVPVYSSGCDRGIHYYAMQYIEGQSLDLAIRQLRQLNTNPKRKRGTSDTAPKRERGVAKALSRQIPSPVGRGAGSEGSGGGQSSGPGVNCPHPNPLPKGEGTVSKRQRGDDSISSLTLRVSMDNPTERDDGAATVGRASAAWNPAATAADLSGGEFFRTVARLGVEAADALEYAHQCGVVHRDIKPSNLLLDDQGQLWISDFGLARFDANASLTATGDMLGTVRYMSPEQVANKPGMVDGRTDVYSLGITLYELATLREAFPGGDRQTLPARIAADEPPPPRQLNRAIPPDLETVLLKAIAKSPADRYLSAKDLADDLRRFMDGKAVLARRASIADRAAKWARRHRTLVAAAAVVLAVVLVASVAGTLMIAAEQARTKSALAEAKENLRQADANLRRAETHFRELREVVDRFGAYHAERMKDLPGVEPLRRELLLETLNYYRDFIRYASDDPKLRADLAVTWSKSAAVAEELGDHAAAVSGYREAAKAFAELVAAHPRETRYEADLALCRNNLGLAMVALGKTDEAQTAYAAAAAIQRRLVAASPDSSDFQRDLALTCGNLGLLARTINQPARAEEYYREAIGIQERLVARHADEPEYQHHLALSYNNLSFLHAKSDPKKAEAPAEKARAIQEQLASRNPDRAEYQSDLALAFSNLGSLQSYNNKNAEAEASYNRAIAIQQQLVRKSPAVASYRRDLAISHNNLGRLHSKLKKTDAARAAFEKARTIMQELIDDDRQELSYRSSLGGIENNLGMVFEDLHRPEEAAAMYQRAIESQRFCCQQAPQVAEFREFLVRHFDNHRRVLMVLDKWTQYIGDTKAECELLATEPEELLRIATELAAVADGGKPEKPSTDGAEARQRCRELAVAILAKAVDAGLSHPERLESEAALKGLRSSREFERVRKQIASLKR